MKPLGKSFFKKPTLEVAKNLLGCYLIHETLEGKTIGKIVEVEAYLQGDSAAHTFGGKTERNKAMFGPPGHAYIYFTYGMHYCFNCTTNKDGIGEGVLIRALEPIEGLEIMEKHRGVSEIKNLCSGPAKLVKAMGITKADYGIKLIARDSKLKICPPNKKEKIEIIETKRIGISKSKDLPHRFLIKDSQYVSKK